MKTGLIVALMAAVMFAMVGCTATKSAKPAPKAPAKAAVPAKAAAPAKVAPAAPAEVK